jgi:hypothetical protein
VTQQSGSGEVGDQSPSSTDTSANADVTPSPVSPPSPSPDQAWKALSLVNDWVKHAETKSVAILAAAGVAGGVAYNLLKDQTEPGAILSVVAVVGCLAIFLAGLFAMASLAPRLKVPGTGGLRDRWRKWRAGHPPTAAENEAEEVQAEAEENPTNLLFYGDVKRDYGNDAPTYAQVLAALTGNDREITDHIALQVHANSLVAHRKYFWANWAIKALRVGLIGLAVIALIIGNR